MKSPPRSNGRSEYQLCGHYVARGISGVLASVTETQLSCSCVPVCYETSEGSRKDPEDLKLGIRLNDLISGFSFSPRCLSV